MYQVHENDLHNCNHCNKKIVIYFKKKRIKVTFKKLIECESDLNFFDFSKEKK